MDWKIKADLMLQIEDLKKKWKVFFYLFRIIFVFRSIGLINILVLGVKLHTHQILRYRMWFYIFFEDFCVLSFLYIIWMLVLDGQELTIQKQPNTSLRDSDLVSPS